MNNITDTPEDAIPAKDDPTRPHCNVWWNGPGSAEITVEIDGCTPPQLWAAAKMIEHFANELYAQGRVEQQAQQVREQLEAQDIAQQIMGVSKPQLVTARAVPTAPIKRSDA